MDDAQAERELALLLRATKRRKLDLDAEDTMERLSMLILPSAAELTSWERQELQDCGLQSNALRTKTRMHSPSMAQGEQVSSARPDVSNGVVLRIEHSGPSHSVHGWQPRVAPIVKACPDPLVRQSEEVDDTGVRAYSVITSHSLPELSVTIAQF